MNDYQPIIEVVAASGTRFDEKEFVATIARVVPLLRTPGRVAAPVARASFRIVDDAEMSTLHERHSKIAGTTDVLTFPWASPPEPIEVDVAICHDEAKRRAAELGHSVDREVILYAVHGLLHAAGFTDDAADAHAAMHAEEDRLLEAIGVGATFVKKGGGS